MTENNDQCAVSNPGSSTAITESTVPIAVDFGTARKIIGVLLLTLLNLLNIMDRFGTSGVLSRVEEYFGVHDSSGGLIQTFYVVAFIAFAAAMGYLGDRFNRKWIMILALVCWLILTTASTFVPKNAFWAFVTLRALIGIGDAACLSLSPTIIGDLFVDRARSIAIVCFYLSLPIGGYWSYMLSDVIFRSLSYIVTSNVADGLQRAGGHDDDAWRWAMRVVPALGLITLILHAILMPEPIRGQAEHVASLKRHSIRYDLVHLLTKLDPSPPTAKVAFSKTYIFVVLGLAGTIFSGGTQSWWISTLFLRASKFKHFDIDQVLITYGFIVLPGGIIGITLGVVVAQFWYAGRGCFRSIQTGRALPLTAFIMTTIGVPLNAGSLNTITVNLVLCYGVSFFGVLASAANYALTVNVILHVIVPSRRSMATSMMSLAYHVLGDGPGPWIIGQVADSLRASDDTDEGHFYALLKALYITTAMLAFSALMYLIASLFIVADRRRCVHELAANDLKEIGDNTSRQSSIVEKF